MHSKTCRIPWRPWRLRARLSRLARLSPCTKCAFLFPPREIYTCITFLFFLEQGALPSLHIP